MNLYADFMNKIIQQTTDGLLKWDAVESIANNFSVEDFDFILLTNEFHRINELDSFGVVNEELNIFLIDEVFESGKDGSISEELNLYIIKGISGKSYKVPLDEEQLTHLREVIKKSSSVKNNLDNILKKYISDN